jgi:tetratricopeptide (TPR) repeat protein
VPAETVRGIAVVPPPIPRITKPPMPRATPPTAPPINPASSSVHHPVATPERGPERTEEVPQVRRGGLRIDTVPEPVRTIRSELVGRATALATLRDVVARAIEFAAPQLVTIVGNQGTGKTRLINELIDELPRSGDRAVRVLHGAAERDADAKPIRLAAIASLLRDRFEMTPHPDDATRLRFAHEIKDVLGDGQVAEMLHLIGGYVGLDYAPTPFLRAITDSPRQRAELARTALRRFLELDAGKGALVLVLDDLQWADDDTLALVHELAVGLGGSPVVILAAARPEMLVRSASWGEGAIEHARIDVRNLEPEDADAMFRNLLVRCAEIPDDTVQDAVEMTGGNPAFLEQLVRLFLHNGTIDVANGTWRLDPDKAAETELPISIEEAIEARIAALEADERDLLEKAAVFGNVFWVSAVIAMTRIERAAAAAPPAPDPPPLEIEWGNGEDVRRRVSDVIYLLADQDYLLPLDADDSSIPGDVEVVFKHNLERELVVRSMEPGRLARYHLAAAQWLEAKLSHLRDEQLEFLAGLYERGGDTRRAARCYLQGGDRARARYAPDEARALYEKGLAMLGETDAPARLDALHNLGDVLEAVGRTDDARGCFMQMLQLAWRFDNLNKAGAAYARLGRVLRRTGGYDLAMEHLRRANELFERSKDDRGIASTLDDMGRIHWIRGAYGQALEFHRQALTTRRALNDRRSIALSLANIGRVHHDTGNFTAAIAQFREALDLRRDIGDLVGVVQSLCDLAGVYGEDGSHQTALELLGEARVVAQDTGDKLALADVLSRAGEVKAAMGKGVEAAKDLNEAKALAAGLGDRVALASAHQRLAQVELGLGHLDAADTEARAGVAISEQLGLRVQVGCGYRVQAEVAAALGRTAQAEDAFRRAIDILAAVKHEVELARAYTGLAALKERLNALPEATKLRSRAADIFSRLRGAASSE